MSKRRKPISGYRPRGHREASVSSSRFEPTIYRLTNNQKETLIWIYQCRFVEGQSTGYVQTHYRKKSQAENRAALYVTRGKHKQQTIK